MASRLITVKDIQEKTEMSKSKLLGADIASMWSEIDLKAMNGLRTMNYKFSECVLSSDIEVIVKDLIGRGFEAKRITIGYNEGIEVSWYL